MIRIESGSENAKIGVADLQWAYHTPRLGVSYAQNLTLRPELSVNAGIWATGTVGVPYARLGVPYAQNGFF